MEDVHVCLLDDSGADEAEGSSAAFGRCVGLTEAGLHSVKQRNTTGKRSQALRTSESSTRVFANASVTQLSS
jgi:hypothetical protein